MSSYELLGATPTSAIWQDVAKPATAGETVAHAIWQAKTSRTSRTSNVIRDLETYVKTGKVGITLNQLLRNMYLARNASKLSVFVSSM